MYHSYDFPALLASSSKASWQIEDVLPVGAALDFSMNFMPENLARTGAVTEITESERRILNQIRGHEYLSIFGLVEEFILPFVLDHARPMLNGDDHRVRALLNFASEEAKHIHLFKQFHARFSEGFGTACDVIGPPDAVAAEVLRHDPLAVAMVILHIEWMTQRHYLDSVKGNGSIDPLFASLLRHHWMEEAQHAKLDTLMVEALAEGRDAQSIAGAVGEYLEIGMFLDNGLRAQTDFNLDALERATGRTLSDEQRVRIASAQHQALRWTYLGSGMTHPEFCKTIAAISPQAAETIADVASAFC